MLLKLRIGSLLLILAATFLSTAMAQTGQINFGNPGSIGSGGMPSIACTRDGKIWAVWHSKDQEIFH